MIRHFMIAAALLASGSAWALTMQCEPIPDEIIRVTFDGVEEKQEVMATLPKTHKGAELGSLSLVYGTGSELVVTLDLWPGENDQMEAHFEVAPGQREFSLRARYSQGACFRDNVKVVQSWQARHR